MASLGAGVAHHYNLSNHLATVNSNVVASFPEYAYLTVRSLHYRQTDRLTDTIQLKVLMIAALRFVNILHV